MELIGNHLQIFVSLVVILAAAAVALVCDLLKRNNEHLRELNVELRVRHEEETRRSQMLAKTANAIAAPSAPIAALSAPAATTSVPAPIERSVPAVAAQPAMDRAAEFASRRGRQRETAATEEPAVTEQTPGQSLAEARMLAREFMGRAAVRAGHSTETTPSTAPIVAKQPEVIIEKKTAETAKPTRKDWSKILNSTRRPAPETVEVTAEPKRGGELIPFESIQNQSELTIPEGFHEGMMLARILTSEKSVRGLVVVIGINDFAARRQSSGELGAEALVASFTDHIRGILRPGDFACQSNSEEFLLICPNEHDASAQRRLGEIGESLWDFQLRSVGTSVILFSWGGVEAKGDSLADVVSTASERMRETRRSRRSLSMEAPLRKRAV